MTRAAILFQKPGEAAQANVYNGLDERVTVTSGGTVRRFVYDPDGRVIGEYGTSATDVIAERIWLTPAAANDNLPFGGDDGTGGYAPLAIVAGSTLTFVHGTHLGVPQVYTSATGAVVATPAYTLPGFPGQYRTLADLSYNKYRDYDPSTGRYLQADPIGLAGGSNPYLYAEGNPVRYVDPKGTFAFLLPVLCAGGGCEAAVAAITVAVVGYVGYNLYSEFHKDICDVDYGTVLEMSKGGKQNKGNEWSRAARQEQPNDPCSWLQGAYNDPSTTAADRQKIKTAQKFLGCRRRG